MTDNQGPRRVSNRVSEFTTIDPAPLGAYMVKVSVSKGLYVIVWWDVKFERVWDEVFKKTDIMDAGVRYCSTEPQAKDFLNKLAGMEDGTETAH